VRICLITAADPEEALTGVATYVRDLASALVRRGHDVGHVYLRPALRGRAEWAIRWTARGAVRCAGVAIAAAPQAGIQERLRTDAQGGILTRGLVAAVRSIGPDVVHLHDLSGVPADLIPACRAAGYPVVVTLHDFWALCRRLLFVRPDLSPCDGPDHGRNCARYCTGTSPVSRRLAARIEEGGGPLARPVRAAHRVYRRLRGFAASQFIVPDAVPVPTVPAAAVVRAFASRETLIREAVLQATSLLVPSEDTRAQYVYHGYPAGRIRVMPLSLLFEGPPLRPRAGVGHPVRFGYLGRVNPWKGAHILAAAAAGIRPDRARFTFYGAVEREDQRYLTALAGGAGNVFFRGRYVRAQLAHIMEEIDVAVFPSIMRETQGLVGLEAQCAGLPIVAAAGGAIPEYVRDGIDGLLFVPGSTVDLRRQLQRLIDAPDLIGRLAANVRPPRRMEAHLADLLPVYENAARGGVGAAASV
jgi:glycosyltransferase involved in cell wall biosynthesis